MISGRRLLLWPGMQADSPPAIRRGSYPQCTSRCSPAVGNAGGKAPLGSLWRRRLVLWDPGSDSGRDPHQGRRGVPHAGAASAPGWASMPAHLLLERRAVDVGVMPSLLPALDHTTRVVVGADATVDRRPRQERSGRRWRGRHTTRVGLLLWWRESNFGWFPPPVTRAASGARCSGLSAVK